MSTIVNTNLAAVTPPQPWCMSGDMKAGERVAELRKARGWSRPALASLMGTSPQQLERLEKGQRKMSEEWLRSAATALNISASELMSQIDEVVAQPVAEAVNPNATPFKYEGGSLEQVRDDLPFYGTALGAARQIDGDAVEQTYLNTGDVVEYRRRPPILNGRSDVYGLYVVGDSMTPAHRAGATIIAETKRPPRIGDDVVVYLRPRDENDDGERARAVLVKRLVKRAHHYVELEQFTPPLTFRIDAADLVRIDRVLTTDDLLA